MRVGVVTPATDRGLGIQTWEAARHLDASVLLVDRKDPRFPIHPERFPGAVRVRWAQGLDPNPTMAWLRTVDAVYSAETFFDRRFTKWARAAGVRTFLHANPEFWTGADHPTEVWSATPWRREVMPPHTQVVPFPVAADRFTPAEPHDGPCRWLHVAGKRALADRNGTQSLLDALRFLRHPCQVTIVVQHGEVPDLPETPRYVSVRVMPPQPNYWDLYHGFDALVLPRRYGGLCLPVQEAIAAGLAVVMSELSPNEVWPGPRVSADFDRKEVMPCGRVPVYAVRPRSLAAMMDVLADPVFRAEVQAESRAWAAEHSWEALGPVWLERLGQEVAA